MTHHHTIYGFSHLIHKASERLMQNEIFCCQTSLVESSLKDSLFSWDDIYNLYDKKDELQEVLEWWTVSEFLADELRELTEPILSNEYGIWWGRTCSGQSIILDGTIQQIIEKIDRAI